MYIKTFRGYNYKSILDSGLINFAPGINIITGQNNAGKSAILKLLSGKFDHTPHRSRQTIPIPTISQPSPHSHVEMDIAIPLIEFLEYVFSGSLKEFILENYLRFSNHSKGMAQICSPDFFTTNFGNEVIIRCVIHGGGLRSAIFPQLGNLSNEQKLKFQIHEKKLTNPAAYSGGGPSDFSSFRIGAILLERIYRFSAERFNIGHCRFGRGTVLTHNAANLPEVLLNLQSHPTAFKKYNQLVNAIFPTINHVAVKAHASQDNVVEIAIYNDDPELDRADLTVTLEECGTGVSQVLSILYVVVTADVSKIIIIDEPNSFLHPGAARKLIEILKQHPQHQFIISTHSPTTISAASPASIHVIKTENAVSCIESLDLKEVKNQAYFLVEIGSKLSDLFGADNIIWVEGATEEYCFPKIVEATTGISLMGTVIVGVKHTGDFESKDAKTTFEIYSKLSQGKSLIPPAVGFIFDREDRKKSAMDDLRRQAERSATFKGKVEFTKRRLFENYLLNIDAIVAVINSSSEEVVTKEEVAKWFEENKWDKKYKAVKLASENDHDGWLIEVDGARLLKDLFENLSGGKLEFVKTKHSVALCDWIIENSIQDLEEIQLILRNMLTDSSA